MIELMTAHPWMTYSLLLVLVASVSFRFVIPLGSLSGSREIELPEQPAGVLTPEVAREHMLTPRQRVARDLAEEFEEFIARGNPDASFLRVLDPETENVDHVIAELLEYKAVGWNVEFGAGYAQISLPGVAS